MFRCAVQRRCVVTYQTGNGRDHEDDALFICAEERAHADAGQFDWVGDVDVYFGVALCFRVIPEVGPCLLVQRPLETVFFLSATVIKIFAELSRPRSGLPVPRKWPNSP